MERGLEEYILAHIDEEGELLARLNREAHVRLLRPRMIAGHLQGRILKMLVRLLRPQRILEIGTYTAYATLCMAEGLPKGGEIHTVEIDDEMEDFIRHALDYSPLKDRIHLHIGDAMDVVPQLDGDFDMAYMDGDKRTYCECYDLLFNKIRKGGFIIADNTLWDGKILHEPHPSDKQTLGIQAFNEKIKHDKRVEKVILPVRDGVTIVYKILDC